MSRDIRSFFLPKGGQKSENKQEPKPKEIRKKSHKRIYVIDSDSEEEKSPPKRGKDFECQKKDSTKNKVGKQSPKLKPVNIADAFGTNKVKRSLEKNVVQKNEKFDIPSKTIDIEDAHSDLDFEATLRQVEELEAAYEKEKSSSKHSESNNIGIDEVQESTSDKGQEESKSDSTNLKGNNKYKESAPKLSHISKNDNVEKETAMKDKCDSSSPKQEEKKRKRDSPGGHKIKDETFTPKEKKHRSGSPSQKPKNTSDHSSSEPGIKVKKDKVNMTSSINSSPCNKPDATSPAVDSVERKREHVIHYLKYLQREGPKHLGSKEIPKGKPGCLSGLTFVITGVLDSLERDQAANLIKECGGKVTTSVSKKTSYLVLGDEPGASKIDKAATFKTPHLDEDGLLKLIVDRSGAMPDDERTADRGKQNSGKKSELSKDVLAVKKENHLETSPPVSKTEGNSLAVSDKKVSPSKSEMKKEISQAVEQPSLWVEKYRPTSSKQVIGQQGDRSAMKKLMTWLNNWHRNHSGNKKLTRPSPWAKDDDGAYYKAALVSGPPGIGKTTMAHVVSKELGFDIVEFNASDTRSKSRLHDEVKTLLSSQSLFGYFHESGARKTSSKHVLIMDEVDGMAGNEDRGGVQELIQLIKTSHVPIICTCNDRNHPKIRSLVNYCFDLRVQKPRVEQIRGSMMSICFKEGLKIPADAMTDMINGANQDIRQILNHMAMWTARNKQLSSQEAKYESEKAKKDLKMGPWDALKKVFSAEDHKTMSIHDKSDLFFYDYSLSPLFVQENYLSVVPIHAQGNIVKTLAAVANSAESICMGDVVDRTIRSNNAWSLLPVQAMFSSVLPGDYMEGYLRSKINFPSWLGKNSRRNKLDRMLQELQIHMRLTTSASKESVNMDYLPSIRNAIFNPLIKEGTAGIPSTLRVMEEYHLIREDLESVIELSTWPGDKDPMSLIDSKVKAAMTRAYNKEGILTPYSVGSVIKKHSTSSSQLDEEDDEDDADGDDKDDDIAKDAMIKAKKQTAPKAQHKESEAIDSGKGKGKGKGRGKKKAE